MKTKEANGEDYSVKRIRSLLSMEFFIPRNKNRSTDMTHVWVKLILILPIFARSHSLSGFYRFSLLQLYSLARERQRAS